MARIVRSSSEMKSGSTSFLNRNDNSSTAMGRLYTFPSQSALDGATAADGVSAGCLRGTGLVIGLELAAGLSAYGVWLLFHLAH